MDRQMNPAATRSILLSLLLLGAARHAHAQFRFGGVPEADIRIEPAALKLEADKPAVLAVYVVVPKGHHAYLDKGKTGKFLDSEVHLQGKMEAMKDHLEDMRLIALKEFK